MAARRQRIQTTPLRPIAGPSPCPSWIHSLVWAVIVIGVAVGGAALPWGMGSALAAETTASPAAATKADAAEAESAKVREALKTLSADATAFRNRVLHSQSADPTAAAHFVRDARAEADKGDHWDAVHRFERALRLGHAAPDRWLTLADYYDHAEGPEPNAVLAAYLHAAESGSAGARAAGLLKAADLLLAAERDSLALALYRRAQAALPTERGENGIAALTGESLAVRRLSVEADRDIPRLCLFLTAAPAQRTPEGAAITPGDYVSVAPDVEVVVTVADKRLCVDGLPHGQDVTVTVKPGLPATSGARLGAPLTVATRIPNREPRLAFSSDAYILPARGVREVALRSVNLEQASLTLYRVNARGLPALLRQRSLSESVTGGDLFDIAENAGETVWQGRLDIDSTPNQEVATAIPIAQILARPDPGLYLLAADDPVRGTTPWWDKPAQWLLITDIGLQTAKGLDGLSVFARSLSTGRPMTGATLSLVARNNAELGQAITDRNGLARFPDGLLGGAGGRAPSWIMAQGPDGDFAFLDITGPAFDLTDRGVGGRESPGPLDAYLYSDRGIYRPGETVHLVALLRDSGARALSHLPLTLKVLRPDGVQVGRHVLEETAAGGYSLSLPLLKDARIGRWQVTAHVDPKAPPIGRIGFAVEDFVPQTMEVTLASDRPVLDVSGATTDSAVALDLAADYLYGAPAADLPVDAHAILTTDPAPFPGFEDFRFGLVQDTVSSRRIDLPNARTNPEGKARIEVSLDAPPDTSHPLRALITARVSDAGGRGADRTLVLPVRHQDVAVGIRPTFGDDVVAEGSRVVFEVVALDAQGTGRPDHALNWVLYEEVSHYSWYESGGSWSYRRTVRDEPRASGRVTTGDDGLGTILADVEWGAFRLEVSDAQGSLAASSTRFRAGWWVADIETQDTPDTLKIIREGEGLRPGDLARLRLTAPFAGEALVQVVTDRVLEVINVPMPAAGLTVELPVTEAWGVGAYVVATAFRPGDGAGPRGPGRAMGVAWVPVDTSDKELSVALEVPERIRPRSTWGVPVTVSGGDGGPVWVTLAAVDEGILALTDFQSPDPAAHYHGKRSLGVAYRDAYGRLLRAPDARPGRLRQGGDASGRQLQGLPESSVRTVALFSGIVPVDPDGRALIPLSIPDFNGRLRLMAVAFGAGAVGRGEASVIVRDPLVAMPSLPRFLAPGDRGTLTLSLDNQDGPAGDWRVIVEGEGAVGVEDGQTTLALEQGDRAVVRATLVGLRPGSGSVAITLDPPRGKRRTTVIPLDVRPAAPRATVAHAMDLAPNDRAVLTDALLDGVAPTTARVTLSLSTLPNLDPLGNAQALIHYPYGCLEQTASRALAGLYSGALEAEPGRHGPRDWSARDVLAKDIQRLISLQRPDGGFALWESWGGLEPWLSAYALDVLLRARGQGLAVPDFALDRGLAFLQELVADPDASESALPVAAYAHYVLARAGRSDLGRLRYFHDVSLHRLPTALSRLQTAAALALLGDQQRAEGALRAALDPQIHLAAADQGGRSEREIARDWGDYGSLLRDQAAALALGLETGLIDSQALDAAQALADAYGAARHLSTQERGWMLLASQALLRLQGTLVATVDGSSVETGQVTTGVTLPTERLRRGVEVTNDGNRPLRLIASVEGHPQEPPPADSQGLVVRRRFLDLSGHPVALDKVRQNTLLVALIEGRATAPAALAARNGDQVLVVDLLPAGLEIETPTVTGGSDTDEGLAWLPETTVADHVEARDDRYVAAVTLDPDAPAFTLAYVVRAVSPGSYLVPGVAVEAMYRPALRANQDAGRLTVLPR